MSSRKNRGFTLAEMLVVILCIGMLCALLIPAIHKAIRRSGIAACSGNLSQMWKMVNIYRSHFGCPMKSMPTGTGGAFWRSLEHTSPPLLDATSIETFLCPVKGAGMLARDKRGGKLGTILQYAIAGVSVADAGWDVYVVVTW